MWSKNQSSETLSLYCYKHCKLLRVLWPIFGMASHNICDLVWEKESCSLCTTIINIVRLLVCVKGALAYFSMASLTIFVTTSAIP